MTRCSIPHTTGGVVCGWPKIVDCPPGRSEIVDCPPGRSEIVGCPQTTFAPTDRGE
jgi:hypothetical protein